MAEQATTLDAQARRKLDVDYLSYLKALEYSKVFVNRYIASRKNERDALCVERQVPRPTVAQPKTTLKNERLFWFILSAVLFLVSLIITAFNESGVMIFLTVVFVGTTVYTAIKWKNATKDYNKALASYNNAQSAYEYQLKAEQMRLERERPARERAIKDIEEAELLLEKIKAVRLQLYRVNYIPFQHRNLQSIAFFDSQLSSSPLKLINLISWKNSDVYAVYMEISDYRFWEDSFWAIGCIGRDNFWEKAGKTAAELIDVLKVDDTIEKDAIIDAILASKAEIIQGYKEGEFGVKYDFRGANISGEGNIFGDVDKNEQTINQGGSPDNDYLQLIYTDLKRLIEGSTRGDKQHLLQELEDKKVELARKKKESRELWWNRIFTVFGAFANAAQIAGFAIDLYSR
ncbi:MAG: hypothetical protein LBN05_08190 [Oscillospiraceae bacterium]|nr:hypothetical protein [Oscillospiraceae bacterium]